MRIFVVIFAGLVVACVLFAQGPPPLERILLPIITEPTPGGFGSLWVTDFSAFNDGDVYASMAPLAVADWPGIPPKTGMKPPVRPRPIGHQPGKFIWVLKSEAPALKFNLRVQDLSRQSLTWGTEIPVVREAEFTSGALHLLNVPVHVRFRQTLRIYQALNTGEVPGEVRVQLFRMNGDALFPTEGPVLHEEVVTLSPEGPPYEYVPGYAELGGFNAKVEGVSAVRIQIEPLAPNMRYWAFVSVTNNETQHVTTITPR